MSDTVSSLPCHSIVIANQHSGHYYTYLCLGKGPVLFLLCLYAEVKCDGKTSRLVSPEVGHAEWEYAGVPCGIMDPLISVSGKQVKLCKIYACGVLVGANVMHAVRLTVMSPCRAVLS